MTAGEHLPSLTYAEQLHELHVDESYQPSPFQRTRITDEAFIQLLTTPRHVLPQLTVKWVNETYSDWLTGVCTQLDALDHHVHLRTLQLHPTFVQLPLHHLLRRIARCDELTLYLDVSLVSNQHRMRNAERVLSHVSMADVGKLTLMYSNSSSAFPTVPNTLLRSLLNSTTTLRSIELPQSLLTSTSYDILLNGLNACPSLHHLTITGSNTLCSPSHDQHSAVLYIKTLQLLDSGLSQRLLSLKLHICTGDELEVVDTVCKSICNMTNLQKLHVTTSRRFNQLRPSPPTVTEPLSVRLLQVGSQHRSGTLQDITIEFDNISLDNDIRVFGGPYVKQQIFSTVNSWTNVFYAKVQTPVLSAYDSLQLEQVLHRSRYTYRSTIDTVLDTYDIHEWAIRDLIYEHVFLKVDDELRYGSHQATADLPRLTPSPPRSAMFNAEMQMSEQNINVY